MSCEGICHAWAQVGMLALEALFVLVTQHGLDYPDLYPSLYGMLTPQIFLVGAFHPLPTLYTAHTYSNR